MVKMSLTYNNFRYPNADPCTPRCVSVCTIRRKIIEIARRAIMLCTTTIIAGAGEAYPALPVADLDIAPDALMLKARSALTPVGSDQINRSKIIVEK